MALPLIAIVGAPNVGKSTLFNRLLGRRRAIVTDEPGMTRDRLYAEVTDVAHPFRLVDTGGMTPGVDAPFAREIEQQAEAALDEAAVVLFVVDARSGASALDHDLTRMLRRRGQPMLLVANKVDGPKIELQTHELHALGVGAPIPISAEHGQGIEELIDVVAGMLAQLDAAPDDAADDERWLSVAILGRPNVGKSSIFNHLVGEKRAMVSDLAGTTRAAVDTLLQIDDRRFRLIDTAGLRRRGKIERGPERFSVQDAHRNIDRCDVAVLVLDATEPLASQDAHIAGYIDDAYKPMVVAINKWDLMQDRALQAKEWEEQVRHRLRFARHVPFAFVSARTGTRILKLLDHVTELHQAASIRIPTPDLNVWLQGQVQGDPHSPPPNHAFRLFYATQTGICPPRFVLFCNDPRKLHFSVRRQLENSLRERFGFGPSPIRLQFRSRRVHD